jgi:DNA-binding beta-propeller fold protein YncE
VLVLLLVAGLARAHVNGAPQRSSPIQVDADGFVYVVNPDSDSMTRLTPLSSGAQTVLWESPPGAVGDYPRTLTLAGDSVFTANQNDDTVTRIARADGTRQGQVSLGFGCAPYGIAANLDGDKIYVACQGTQELVVLTPAPAVEARIRLDWPMPRAVAVSGDDLRVYVSHFLTVEPNHDAHVSEIDAQTNALTGRRFLTIPADRRTCETQNSGQGVTNIVNSLALTPPGSPPEVANQLWVGGTLQNNLTKGLFRRHAAFKGQAEVARFDLPCPADDLTESCLFEGNPRAGICQPEDSTDGGKPCLTDAQCAGGGICVIVPNSTAAVKRNIYKVSFHDVTRFVIWKLDLETGEVVGKVDVDEANHATDMAFSADGATAYAVDQMFHSFHLFSTRRGQDGNPGTLFAPVARYGPFGIDPSRPCDADALGSVGPEGPFIIPRQAQITPIDGGDPIKVTRTDPPVSSPVATGVDFDTRRYHTGGSAAMRLVPDAIGTAPIGVALSPDGCVAYVANYLARNVVAVSARSQVGGGCEAYDPVADLRCTTDISRSCDTRGDCPAGAGFCNHPGGPACTTDADCVTEPCITDNNCVPLVAADPVATTALVSEEIPAEILDGKILFNTAARDSSVPNGVGLGLAAPLFNDVRRGCGQDPARECRSDLNCSFCANAPAGPTCASDADCGGARCVVGELFCTNDPSIECDSDTDCTGGSCESAACNVVRSLPGELVSTSHDASYVTCTACHVDYGGQDGRTWDFAQFGASLRNTMDLRGRSQAAPGTCGPMAADAAKLGATCHFDAACGTGSGPGACRHAQDMAPPHLSAADASRYFNPMISVHWNGDRMEVEGFEFTYRSLLGAGDCDGLEHDPDGCLGALLPRSLLTSTATVPDDGPFEGDLRAPLRNVMVFEPTLGREVNASVRLTHMADFVYSLTRFPRNPFLGDDGSSPADAARRGREVFNDTLVSCAFCHSGPSAAAQLFTDKKFASGFDPNEPPGAATNSVYLRHDVGTANLFDLTDPKAVADANGTFQNGILPLPGARGPLVDYVTPPMNDVWNTPPFLHDGSAPTLLDVVRPCDTTTTDCTRPGLGRNLDDEHGVTSRLTPQQLNDLVAFQLAPHGPVGNRQESVRAGTLELKTLTIRFGKKPGRGSFAVVGTADPEGLPVDPGSGLTFSLAVPGGQLMETHSVSAAAGEVKGRGRRFTYRAARPSDTQGPIKVTLTRLGSGKYRLVATGRRADLSTLDNGAADVHVAVVAGGTQFARNRLLTAKQDGRVLTIPKRRRR